jgi:uncharacterized membrane protein
MLHRRTALPWRYLLFGALCLLTVPLLGVTQWYKALLIAFDLGAVAYFLTLPTLFRLDTNGIRRQAEKVDANRKILLLLTALVMLVILVAIGTVLLEKHSGDYLAVALCFTSLAAAWCFSNMVYTLHYAHLFYAPEVEGDRRGLVFPGTSHPDYWDFAYFAFTLGMTFQTSDVTITGGHMRKVATIQSLAAFVFNIGVLAFSVNILANL